MTALRQWFRSLPARYGRRTLIALALIAALGLVCRAVAVVHPVADPADDSHAYYALAKALYEEGSYGGPEFNSEATSDWSPGAPWLYAGLFVVTGGPREGSIRILEALIGVGDDPRRLPPRLAPRRPLAGAPRRRSAWRSTRRSSTRSAS